MSARVPMVDTWPLMATHADSADTLSRLLGPDLDALGSRRSVLRGARLGEGRDSVLSIVRAGLACRTPPASGVCTGLVRAGDILETGTRLGGLASHGWWMSDGVIQDIPLAALEDRYGRDVRQELSELWLSQQLAGNQTALMCAIQHRGSQRIAGWLAALTEADGVASVTQAQLAAMAGLQRTSVCAVMADLSSRGAIRVGRGKLTVRDRELLLAERCGCAGLHYRN